MRRSWNGRRIANRKFHKSLGRSPRRWPGPRWPRAAPWPPRCGWSDRATSARTALADRTARSSPAVCTSRPWSANSIRPTWRASDCESLGVAGPEWLRRSGVRAVALLPLRHGQRGLGALVVLGKSRPSEEQFRALAGAARLGAEAIGNVEAYRALAGERNRLAAKNARLRSGLGLPVEPEPELEPAPSTAPTSAPPAAPSAPTTAAPAAPSSPAPAPAPLPAAASLAGTGAMLHSERFELPPLRSFAQIQREGILHALERTGWRVSGPHGAAAALGLKPTTLESKMKKLGIRRPRR